MPEYLSPGVYVEEVPAGPRPIQGVGTSTTGVVGITERGPTTPRLVTSWGDFLRWFGDVMDENVSFTSYGARGFFENGGQRLFVARVTSDDAVAAGMVFSTADAAQGVLMQANGPGEWGNGLFVRIAAGSRTGFRVTILYFREVPVPFVDPLDSANIGNPNRVEPDITEDYDDLEFTPTAGNYFINIINSNSTLVTVAWNAPAVPSALPDNIAFGQLTDTPASNGTTPTPGTSYIGDPGDPIDQRTGLAGLEVIDQIALLFIPDERHPALSVVDQNAVMNALVNQCERLRDRFAILQIGSGQGQVNTIIPPQDTTYAAVYYPWIRVFNPRSRDTLLIPPGGHVAGIYARSDQTRGVHKAPANEVVRDIVNRNINSTRKPLEYTISKGEHDILNPLGINVIRDFRDSRRGIRVWGARTLSSDPLWRYVNVRRLFLFVEESIDEGTQWVVFEPNDEPTWARVRQVVGNFLDTVWRDGALQGSTQEQAYFVRCGYDTMTQADIDAGRLICEVGIAPVKPAEFVIFRIQQKTLELAA